MIINQTSQIVNKETINRKGPRRMIVALVLDYLLILEDQGSRLEVIKARGSGKPQGDDRQIR